MGAVLKLAPFPVGGELPKASGQLLSLIHILEITGVADIDRERNAAYQEAGWTYVTTLRNLYYVYRTERADAPPLHTDPVTQSETLTPLIRRTRRSRLFLTLWLLFCFRPTLRCV